MTKKAGLRLALVAVAGAAVVVSTAAQAADPLRVTKPVNITAEDLSPGRTYGAPYLLAHPDNPKLIIAGFIEMRSRQCGIARSTNGGSTWRIVDANPAIPSYPFCLANNSNIFGANIAWGKDDALYLATHAWDTAERNKTSIIVAKSTDLGDSWTTQLVADARPTEGEQQLNNRPVTGIWVDRSGSQDQVYVLFRQAYPGLSAPNALPQQPMVVISRDGGRTYEKPISALGDPFASDQLRQQALSARTTLPNTTTTLAAEGSRGANPLNKENFGVAGNGQGIVMDEDGNLYITYMSATANLTPGAPSALVVSKSTDQGRTWQGVIARPFGYDNAQNPRIAWTPGGGADGTLHVVWEWRNPPTVSTYADIGYIRSTDGGQRWSEPKRIADDNPNNFAGKYLPNITVAPNGRLDVAWWDLRDDPGIRGMDVYYAYSNDDGETWSKNIRMTDQTIDRRFGVWGNNFDQNAPVGLVSTNEYAMIGWDDTRHSRGEGGQVATDNPVDVIGIGGGVQDMFVSAVQFKALGGGTSAAAKGVLAGVIGLLAVGLVLVLASVVSKRRSDDGTPSKRAARESPASVK